MLRLMDSFPNSEKCNNDNEVIVSSLASDTVCVLQFELKCD